MTLYRAEGAELFSSYVPRFARSSHSLKHTERRRSRALYLVRFTDSPNPHKHTEPKGTKLFSSYVPRVCPILTPLETFGAEEEPSSLARTFRGFAPVKVYLCPWYITIRKQKAGSNMCQTCAILFDSWLSILLLQVPFNRQAIREIRLLTARFSWQLSRIRT